MNEIYLNLMNLLTFSFTHKIAMMKILYNIMNLVNRMI